MSAANQQGAAAPAPRGGALKLAKDVIAGTCGGISVTLVGHPFDTLKVRLQTQPMDKPIYCEDAVTRVHVHRGSDEADAGALLRQPQALWPPAPSTRSDMARTVGLQRTHTLPEPARWVASRAHQTAAPSQGRLSAGDQNSLPSCLAR
eukprot:365661-Chlamydomonas_euryale.AAC.49